MNKLSVVLNTFNSENDLPEAIKSIKKLADEIVVVDMESTDNTVKIAKSFGAKVFPHKKLSYVEPARNFGINKASNEWILVLDPDEVVADTLANKIVEILKNPDADYYRLPRKNIIFDKWMEHTRWWPDYNIRLFKKGHVIWSEQIHKIPVTKGRGSDISEVEELAIIHRNYKSIDDYLTKIIRYTTVQSQELIKNGYKFEFADIVKKPFSEFLSRYFAGQGYKDGLHGLVLSTLQAFSELIVYIRVWEKEKYWKKEINNKEIKSIFNNQIDEVKWWIRKEFSWLKNLR